MAIQESIEKMKIIQKSILEFLDKESNPEEHFQKIIQQIKEHHITNNYHELKTLLYMISKILNNHYRYPGFFSKIEKIIQAYKTEIKSNFTDYEIYKIFKKCQRFLLFLFNEQILNMNADIKLPKIIFYYLNPKEAEISGIIEKVPDDFEEKQKIGENDNLISEMIRKDLIDEFITFVNKNDFSLKSIIKVSIFETNDFLLKHKRTTLIEYAAFFGSTQIFKYLYKNGVELTPSLWLYAIHSDNPEMIHLLEENEVEPRNNNYIECIRESIKCHHNDIANYILSNLIEENIEDIEEIDFEVDYKTNIYSFGFHYYNFSYFPQKIKNKIIFYYACQYDYFEIAKYFMDTMNIDINQKIILLKIILIKFEIMNIEQYFIYNIFIIHQ